jgi:hypothetical protein
MDMEQSCTPMDDSFVEMVANAAIARGGKRGRDDAEPESLDDSTQAPDPEAAEADAADVDELGTADNDAEELEQTFADDDEAEEEVVDAEGDSPMEDVEQLDEQEEDQDDEDVDVDDADAAEPVAETSEPEADDDEEDGSSSPRMRLRDPSTIKRSQSSWMFFLADKREEVIHIRTVHFEHKLKVQNYEGRLSYHFVKFQ